jgi:hypothetical protein
MLLLLTIIRSYYFHLGDGAFEFEILWYSSYKQYFEIQAIKNSESLNKKNKILLLDKNNSRFGFFFSITEEAHLHLLSNFSFTEAQSYFFFRLLKKPNAISFIPPFFSTVKKLNRGESALLFFFIFNTCANGDVHITNLIPIC